MTQWGHKTVVFKENISLFDQVWTELAGCTPCAFHFVMLHTLIHHRRYHCRQCSWVIKLADSVLKTLLKCYVFCALFTWMKPVSAYEKGALSALGRRLDSESHSRIVSRVFKMKRHVSRAARCTVAWCEHDGLHGQHVTAHCPCPQSLCGCSRMPNFTYWRLDTYHTVCLTSVKDCLVLSVRTVQLLSKRCRIENTWIPGGMRQLCNSRGVPLLYCQPGVRTVSMPTVPGSPEG